MNRVHFYRINVNVATVVAARDLLRAHECRREESKGASFFVVVVDHNHHKAEAGVLFLFFLEVMKGMKWSSCLRMHLESAVHLVSLEESFA